MGPRVLISHFATAACVQEWKYEVPVIELQRAMRVPRELTERMKGGISKSMIRKLKRQAVDCPVMGKRVAFLMCYFCPNFVRRVRGIVYCKGEPLEKG